MKFNKIILLLPITLVLTSCDGTSSMTTGQNFSSSSVKGDGIISIYSINDFHGKIEQTENYYGMKALQGSIMSNPYYEPTSIIISAGDMWQGSYISGYDKGKSTTELMNAFPFRAMALGNHEFDWGVDQIKANQEVASFPFLCANLIDESTGKRPEFIDDHVVLETEGYKIGLVGAIGSGLESDISSEMIKGYEFSSDVNILRTAYESCVKEGAEVVFLSLHDDQNSYYTDLIQKSGIPFMGIFGGHSHRFQNSSSYNIPYVQGGCDGEGYSYMVVDVNKKELKQIRYTYSSENHITDADASFVKLVDDLIASRPPETVGYISGYWDRTSSGNLVVKAMFEMAKKMRPDKDYDEDSLVAFHNSGGIRGEYPSSDEPILITMADIQIVSPFDNRVVLLPNRTLNSYNLSGVTYPNTNFSTQTKDIVTINYVLNDDSPIFTSEGSESLYETGEEYIIYDLVADYIKENSSIDNPLRAEDFAF